MTLKQPIARKPIDLAHIQSLADAAVAARRGWSGPLGMSMEETEEERKAREKREADEAAKKGKGGNDPDPDDDDTVEIEGRTWKIGDLKRLAADEKRQGKRAGAREVLEQLGVDSVEKAKEIIEAAQAKEREQMSEAERKAADAAAAQKKADADAARAAEERREASIERALVRRGIGDDDLDDARVLLASKLDKDADADAIAEAADSLKERRPELFDTTGTPPPVRRGGELPKGGTGRKGGPKGGEFGAGGLARAQRRFGDKAGKA